PRTTPGSPCVPRARRTCTRSTPSPCATRTICAPSSTMPGPWSTVCWDKHCPSCTVGARNAASHRLEDACDTVGGRFEFACLVDQLRMVALERGYGVGTRGDINAW